MRRWYNRESGGERMWGEGRPQKETCYIQYTALRKPQLASFLAHRVDF